MNLIKNVTYLCLTYSVAIFTAHGAASRAHESKLILSNLRGALLQGSPVNGTEFAQLAKYKILPNAKLVPGSSSDKRTIFSEFILTQKVGDYALIACHLTDEQLNDEIVLLQSLGRFHLWYRKNHGLLKLRHSDLQALARLQKDAQEELKTGIVTIPCYAEQLRYARHCLKKENAEPDLRVTQKLIDAGDANLK